ncbi:hypothetical protein ADK65_06850, partial [Streptomyces sp. NRRL B-1140]
KAGRQFAAMARRGFRLVPATGEAQVTGRCRLGGPALLDPGPALPELSGVPLSLHPVLDTDALAPRLGPHLGEGAGGAKLHPGIWQTPGRPRHAGPAPNRVV